MTKKRRGVKDNYEIPFNDLPILPPAKEFIESVTILKQLVKSSVALAELKAAAEAVLIIFCLGLFTHIEEAEL
jgi:hypothetical protein